MATLSTVTSCLIRYSRQVSSPFWQIVLDALQMEETAAIDSAPVPCVSYKRGKQASDCVSTADYGVCSSKAMKDFGCTLHSVVSLSGLIMGFLLTPFCEGAMLTFSVPDPQPNVRCHNKRCVMAYNRKALKLGLCWL